MPPKTKKPSKKQEKQPEQDLISEDDQFDEPPKGNMTMHDIVEEIKDKRDVIKDLRRELKELCLDIKDLEDKLYSKADETK